MPNENHVWDPVAYLLVPKWAIRPINSDEMAAESVLTLHRSGATVTAITIRGRELTRAEVEGLLLACQQTIASMNAKSENENQTQHNPQ